MTAPVARSNVTVTKCQAPSRKGGFNCTSERVPPTVFQLRFFPSMIEITQPTFAPEVQSLLPMSAPSLPLALRSQKPTLKLWE